MMNKQSLVVGLLLERLADSKVGILVKGINGIQPDEIAAELSSQRKTHIYMAAVGYGISTDVEKSEYTLTPSIEKAVLWRSVPEYAGNIVVFVKTDTDKLHSLAEFDVISLRDVSKYLLELQISNESNAPTQNFWRALQQTSDYYSFEAIMEFVQSISNEETVAEAIPNNMWRLNLLCDADILGTKYKPSDRLTRNRELIFAIGQLSEDSRKKLSRSLAKTEGDDRIRLQNAYNLLQNLYKYGKRDILKQLDFATVQELFSASKANECSVNIGGKDAVCYIPSSCRLSNFIDMTGRTVLLRPIETPNTRTAYAVYAVKYRKGFILLNLAQTNRVIEAQIRRRYFSFLGVRKKISHEYKIGNYKADLFIHDTNTLIEIKSTLSFSKKSTFPTVYSERAVKQLTEISRLLDEGYRACYILVSLNPSVKEITINSEIEDYYKEFMKCIEKGMTYCAFSIRLHEQTPELYAKIKITI